MTLILPFARDRRTAASDEVTSVAGIPIYGSGSRARTVGAHRARGADRSPDTLRAIVLHQTAGRAFVADDLPPAEEDERVRSHSRVDRITAHFVILHDGTVVYTHDIGFTLNDAGGRRGIDIEFAGRFGHTPEPRSPRLTHAAIRGGRRLLRSLVQQLPGLTHIHPHGQVQRGARGKRDSCPGPDIWMNVGEWAVRELGLTCEPPGAGYPPGRTVSEGQRNPRYLVEDPRGP